MPHAGFYDTEKRRKRPRKMSFMEQGNISGNIVTDIFLF